MTGHEMSGKNKRVDVEKQKAGGASLERAAGRSCSHGPLNGHDQI